MGSAFNKKLKQNCATIAKIERNELPKFFGLFGEIISLEFEGSSFTLFQLLINAWGLGVGSQNYHQIFANNGEKDEI